MSFFVVAGMDERTTSGHNNLHLVLECPQTYLKSYPYNIDTMKGGNTVCNLDAIPKGLLLLYIVKINIGSVVIDGNTAQKNALGSSILFSGTNIPFLDRIIVAPCLCHRVHNSYKRVAQKSNKYCPFKCYQKLQKNCIYYLNYV